MSAIRQEGCRDCERSTSGDCGRHGPTLYSLTSKGPPVIGVVVPAPGVGPLPARTVTVVPTCPAHPGAIFDACGSCLRDARERAEKAEAERDAAVAEAGVASREAARRDRSASKAAAALGGVWQPEDWDEGALTGFVRDLAAERDAARREAAEARAALVAAEADLDERRKELAAERGKRRLFKERVRRAANAACTCGGSGPDACCDACRVWHNLGGERMDTAEGTPHRNL